MSGCKHCGNRPEFRFTVYNLKDVIRSDDIPSKFPVVHILITLSFQEPF